MYFRFTIARMLIGLAMCAASIAYFRDTPRIGVTVGAVVGFAFFVMALTTKKSDVSVVLRSYIFAGLGSIIAMTLSPVSSGREIPIGPILTSAVIGWFVAALVNQSRRATTLAGQNRPDSDDA